MNGRGNQLLSVPSQLPEVRDKLKRSLLIIMPLSLVTTLAEADRQQCDIEFIQVTKDRLFTADGCLIKVYTSPYPYFNSIKKRESCLYPFILLSSSPKQQHVTGLEDGRFAACR